jgi:hypothetical protein
VTNLCNLIWPLVLVVSLIHYHCWVYHAFLTLSVVWGEWSDLRPGRLTPRVRAVSIHFIGHRLGSRAGLDAGAKKKNPNCRCRELNPGRPACNWRNWYIFKHWTSQSSLCALQISIWTPLVARHTSRLYSLYFSHICGVDLTLNIDLHNVTLLDMVKDFIHGSAEKNHLFLSV